jgi:predicted DNA-binding transcriptional regulator YafY
MLQGQRVITAEQVAARFEISVRTVYRDIAALGEAGVPIMAEAGVGYSLVRGYHMPPVMFTEAETAALFMSGALSKTFCDESMRDSLESALLKVRAVLPDERKHYVSRLGVSLEVWNRSAGLDEKSLIPVQDAVVRRYCLKIEYDTGGRGMVKSRIVEPLGVMFYSRQWHLIAWCRMRQEIRDFRLDRMRSWRVLRERFSGHAGFSLSAYLDSMLEQCPLIPVQLVCQGWGIDRVEQEFPGQIERQERLSDGRVRVDAQVFALEWMARWVMSLAGAVEVKAPLELRQLVAGEADKMRRAHLDGFED